MSEWSLAVSIILHVMLVGAATAWQIRVNRRRTKWIAALGLASIELQLAVAAAFSVVSLAQVAAIGSAFALLILAIFLVGDVSA